MPEEDIVWKRREDLLTFEEIERVSNVAVQNGIRKIRLTGGEPFARSGIEALLPKLKRIEGLETLAVTTNATLLARKLPTIRPYVDAFNISLDTFDRERFRSLTGRDKLHDVLDGIHRVIDAGYDNLKINVVVMRGINHDEVRDFARFALDHPVTVRFIEFMPFAGNSWTEGKLYPLGSILDDLREQFDIEQRPAGEAPISRDYTIRPRESSGSRTGTIGVIASMSAPFCSGCSRIRLTAEGKIMPCLHSPLEFDLRSVIRDGGTDDDILQTFRDALGQKPKEHPGAEELMQQAQRGMIQIGG
jgi:cyclic pyranopterin phosphate synthase